MATTTKSKVQRKETKIKPENQGAQHERPVQKNKPTEEEIRQKAEEIYNERLVRGVYGTAVEDWEKAEQLLTEK